MMLLTPYDDTLQVKYWKRVGYHGFLLEVIAFFVQWNLQGLILIAHLPRKTSSEKSLDSQLGEKHSKIYLLNEN